jgi:hypothetical protein
VNVGPAFTVNAEAATTLPESEFRIVRLRALAVALPAIVTYDVMCVASVSFVESTVIPLPLYDVVTPLTKPLPTIASA